MPSTRPIRAADDDGVASAAGGERCAEAGVEHLRLLHLPRLEQELARAQPVALDGGEAELEQELVGRREAAAAGAPG